ncbi:hypothetical protein OUZ56_033273 [Daphnia magna]|uniref:Uncharacterized protein n=1 Tax=Daphnia magna TaxID=35525 RepID=A0ABR0BAI6_9CRUS|nr:hypothetical protein OUZ56_033273 [Daphnia magna]
MKFRLFTITYYHKTLAHCNYYSDGFFKISRKGLCIVKVLARLCINLPLFTSGRLQVLMRKPFLQDKRHERENYEKYGVELLKQVSGRIKSNVNEFELPLLKELLRSAAGILLSYSSDFLMLIAVIH